MNFIYAPDITFVRIHLDSFYIIQVTPAVQRVGEGPNLSLLCQTGSLRYLVRSQRRNLVFLPAINHMVIMRCAHGHSIGPMACDSSISLFLRINRFSLPDLGYGYRAFPDLNAYLLVPQIIYP